MSKAPFILNRLPSRGDARDGDTALVMDRGVFRLCYKYNGQWYCSTSDAVVRRATQGEVESLRNRYIPEALHDAFGISFLSGGIVVSIPVTIDVTLGGAIFGQGEPVVSIFIPISPEGDSFLPGGIVFSKDSIAYDVTLGGAIFGQAEPDGRILIPVQPLGDSFLGSGIVFDTIGSFIDVSLGGALFSNPSAQGLGIIMVSPTGRSHLSGGIVFDIVSEASAIDLHLGGALFGTGTGSGIRI